MASRITQEMLRLDLDDKSVSSPTRNSDHKDDDKANNPVSATKRKLMEAKQKDAYFDKEVKAIETTLIVKEISRQFVADALTSASFTLATPRRGDCKK